MAASDPPPYLLTPIDNVMPRGHVAKLLYFPESEISDVSTVVDTFRRGPSKMFEAMPLLSGTLQVTGPSGALCVAAPWSTVDDIFHVKDVSREGGPEYRHLRDKQFPMGDLDSDSIVPLAVLNREKQVMLVQVNIIKGGIILALCMHHSFTDGIGTAAIAKIWAACCRGDDDSRLVTQEMINRDRLMSGWGSATLADFPELYLLPLGEQVPSGAVSWRWESRTEQSQTEKVVFFFPKSKLVELKSMACARKHGEDGDVWVSTNDALCALLGCCIHSERDKVVPATTDKRWIIRMVVGGRRMLAPPLPADYIGNILSFVRVLIHSQGVDSMSAMVADTAHLIRHHIRQRDERYIRKIIPALSSVVDLTRVIPKLPSASEIEFSISSWAGQNYCDLNWGDGVGAKIKRVRFRGGTKDLCIIMLELRAPSFAGEDCGLEVTLGLEKEHMGRLKQNEFFMRFAQFRCN